MKDLNEQGEFKIEKKELAKIKENFSAESLSDEEIKSTINKVYKNQGILVDPHTAVAIGAANKISLEGNMVILATAHPAKFSDVVMQTTNIKPELPENLKNILVKKEKYEKLPRDLKKIQDYILKKIK